MSEALAEILLLGLRETGASIGLALRRAEVPARVIGSDPVERHSRAALDAGAVERVAPPGVAARSANLIVLALPGSESQVYLEMAAARSPHNAVILDAGPALAPRLAWAQDNMPPGKYYLGGVPSLTASALQTPPGTPRADLFAGGTLAIVLPRGTPEEVAGLGPQLAGVLGCEPLFIDPSELDGVEAASEALPWLASSALLRAASRAPNWRETMRMAGRPLAISGALLSGEDPKAVAADLHRNRANVLAKLDALEGQLHDLRLLLQSPEPEGLAKWLTAARKDFDEWIAARGRSDWRTAEGIPLPEAEPAGSLVSRLLLPRQMRGQRRT
jgi:prephenate dehydrogenase